MSRQSEMQYWLALRDREGLTYRELASRSGIPANTLAGWAWRSRRADRRGSEPKFVELACRTPSPSRDARVELVLRGERRLVFAADADVESIARLAAALERC